MNNRRAFIEAIRANPSDDGLRLIFADSIESDEPERAELIRVQVEMATFGTTACQCYSRHLGFHTGGCRMVLLGKRSSELLDMLIGEERWRPREFVLKRPADPFNDGSMICWNRGLVERVRCKAQDWIANADALIAEHPIRKVTLTTQPEWRDYIKGDGWFHRLTGDNQWFVNTMTDDERRASIPLRLRDGLVDQLLRLRWPGIEFELPAMGMFSSGRGGSTSPGRIRFQGSKKPW